MPTDLGPIPGGLAAAAMRAEDANQSWMDRAQNRRIAAAQEQRAQETDALARPIIEQKSKNDLLKAQADYDHIVEMQRAEAEATKTLPGARSDFNFIMQIPDAQARAEAAVEFLARYSQFENFSQWEKEFKGYNEIATKIVAAAKGIDILGKSTAATRTFEDLTSDLSPEDVENARRIKLGLQPRANGAAIRYQQVVGPDGVSRLVAVDPREVGAQVIGSGETFGSGVGATIKKPTAAEGGQGGNVFASQTPAQKIADEAEAKRIADLKAAKPKRQMALAQAEALSNRLTSDIDDLIKKVTAATAGPGGSILEVFPGTTARDLKNNLDSIKANIGFQTLAAMREASPTGGALGNISDTENKLMQNTLGSLEIGQSPAQLIENLNKVRRRLIENYGIVRSAFDSEYPKDRPRNSQFDGMTDEQLQNRLQEIREAQ